MEKLDLIFSEEFWKGTYTPNESQKLVYNQYMKTADDENVDNYFWIFNEDEKFCGICLELLFQSRCTSGTSMDLTKIGVQDLRQALKNYTKFPAFVCLQ